MTLGCWIISGIGLAGAGFMVWVLARVAREQYRKPDHSLMISSIRTVVTILESEDPLPDEDDLFACTKVARKRSGA